MASITAETTPPLTPSKTKPRTWRRRARRFLLVLVTLVLAAYLVVWWVALRIVENPSWPPPADAVTAEGAQAMTESFATTSNPYREDIAINYAATTSTPPDLFLDGTSFFPAMLQDIGSARHSVHMQMFGLTEGTVAQTFTDALIERANAGVEVRLIVDGYGAKVTGESRKYFDAMRESGIEIVVNHEFPFDRDGLYGEQSIDWRQDEIGNADHRKTMVIDGAIGWIGGAGLQDHFNSGSFRDVFARVRGNVVLQMQAVFLTSFHAYGGPVPSVPGSLDSYFPAPPDPGTVPVNLLQNIPGGFVPGTQASQEIIEQATSRLDIMNPYFTDPGMIDRIVDAANRGVHVRVIVSQQSNNAPADAALKHEYGRMIAAGIEIWEYPDTMHAKVTVADDKVIIGTINYDAWALYRNLEIALLFDDPAVAQNTIESFIEVDILNSRPGEAPEGWQERARGWIWNKLAYFL